MRTGRALRHLQTAAAHARALRAVHTIPSLHRERAGLAEHLKQTFFLAGLDSVGRSMQVCFEMGGAQRTAGPRPSAM